MYHKSYSAVGYAVIQTDKTEEIKYTQEKYCRIRERKDKYMKYIKKKCYTTMLTGVLVILLCSACKGQTEETAAQNILADENVIDAGTATESIPEQTASQESLTGQDLSEEIALQDTLAEESKQPESSKTPDTEDEETEPHKEKREPVKVKGIYVSGPIAGTAKMDELIALVDETELNAMVIDIKNDEGRVTYKMQTDRVLEIDAGIRYIPDIEELVAKCKEKDIYLIARIVAFRDPYLAEQKPELAVHTADGEIFRDKNGLAWVNPYCKEVWEYLVEIGAEAANAGFDEIQFDYIRFSTDIKEEEVDYGSEAEQTGKIDIITQFTEYAYDELSPLGVYVAADVFGTVIDNETDQEIVGQDYVQMASHLDYICPMVYPSHYYSGSYGIKVPDAEPYQTIYEAASSSVEELSALPEEERAKVRVWLQGFTASWVTGHISYGAEQIREQIHGAYDAGYDEWILWNAAVNYQPEAFYTEEQAEEEREKWELQKQEEQLKEEQKKQEVQQKQEEQTTQEVQQKQEEQTTQVVQQQQEEQNQQESQQ